jgi:hypothetical protein
MTGSIDFSIYTGSCFKKNLLWGGLNIHSTLREFIFSLPLLCNTNLPTDSSGLPSFLVNKIVIRGYPLPMKMLFSAEEEQLEIRRGFIED